MKRAKRRRLERAGWRVGTAAELLGLEAAEAALVELKVGLGRALRARRAERGWTQGELAKRLGSSQSRVAKMEAADASVSVDLLVRSLLALDARPRELARVIERGGA